MRKRACIAAQIASRVQASSILYPPGAGTADDPSGVPGGSRPPEAFPWRSGLAVTCWRRWVSPEHPVLRHKEPCYRRSGLAV